MARPEAAKYKVPFKMLPKCISLSFKMLLRARPIEGLVVCTYDVGHLNVKPILVQLIQQDVFVKYPNQFGALHCPPSFK
jgi:hypothetical protein